MRAREINLTPEECEEVKSIIKDHVIINGMTGCHIWKLAKNKHGYGNLGYKGRTYMAHRISYAVHNGGLLKTCDEDGNKLIVRHLCNTPSCAYNEHLESGTYLENLEDQRRSGTLAQGERNGNAAISEDTAKAIIASKGTATRKERSELHGVSVAVIYHIDCGDTWRHLHRPDEILPPQKRRKKKGVEEWTLDIIDQVYIEKVAPLCKVASEPNEFMGTPCHEWIGDSVRDGRGSISVNHCGYYAHIVACMYQERRARLENLITLHGCGNEICCRPDHLRFGTSAENHRDRLKMGRGVKIKENDVREIRKLRADGMKLIDIAEMYGVSLWCISDIARRKNWSWVE